MEDKKSQRNPIACPVCHYQGELVLGTHFIHEHFPNAYYLRCSSCDFEWEINEDYNCGVCGADVPGRYLTCKSSDCIVAFEKMTGWEPKPKELTAEQVDVMLTIQAKLTVLSGVLAPDLDDKHFPKGTRLTTAQAMLDEIIKLIQPIMGEILSE